MTSETEAARILARLTVLRAMMQALRTEREAAQVIAQHQKWQPIPDLPERIK